MFEVGDVVIDANGKPKIVDWVSGIWFTRIGSTAVLHAKHYTLMYRQHSNQEPKISETKTLELVKSNNGVCLAYGGDVIPNQCSLKLKSLPDELSTVTVEFYVAGEQFTKMNQEINND
jgi:hypothetical protein